MERPAVSFLTVLTLGEAHHAGISLTVSHLCAYVHPFCRNFTTAILDGSVSRAMKGSYPATNDFRVRKMTQDDRSPDVFAVAILFFVLTWLTVGLRVYVRTILMKSWGKDDSCMVAALV
jgi:hypothetical protein